MQQRKSGLIAAVLAVSLTFILSSCDNEKKLDNIETAPPQDTSIILSADGIGPINSTTSFNMHQMTVAFSDYNVVEEVKYTEGTALPAIRISEGVNTIMKIIPDASRQSIYSVIIEDNIVKNSLGHALGTSYSKIYSYGQNEKCQPGVEEYVGKMLCYAPGFPNILYVFNGEWADATTGKAPPADVLQAWALESIIWRPKS